MVIPKKAYRVGRVSFRADVIEFAETAEIELPTASLVRWLRRRFRSGLSMPRPTCARYIARPNYLDQFHIAVIHKPVM